MPWPKGQKPTPEHRAKISAGLTGTKRGPYSPEHRAKISAGMQGRMLSPKQTEALAVGRAIRLAERGLTGGYASIHMWLTRNHPKTGRCEQCGATPNLMADGRAGTDYALRLDRTHAYDRSSYEELCRRCHRQQERETRHLP